MSFKTKPYMIREIDERNRVIRFDPSSHGKITGSRLSSVLGRDQYNSEFSAACFISRIYSEFEPTKYTEAGEKIEPTIRAYMRKNGRELLEDPLNLSSIDRISVEEPVSKWECNFDHFQENPVFGGMVDGYIRVEGKRRAILEIKTSNNKDKWRDSHGNFTVVPENYVLQASLYAELADLDEIVFAVGFLKEEDYDRPEEWKPDKDNFIVVTMIKQDISEEMDIAAKWFQKYILSGVTPQWTERDSRIVDRFMVRELDFISGDVADLIRRYARTRDPALEGQIKDMLKSSMAPNSRSTVYEQEGLVFRLDQEETLDIERMKADGIYDRYLKKDYRLTVEKK